MKEPHLFRTVVRGLAATAAAAAAGYATLVVFNRLHYGSAAVAASAGNDPLLDRFIPDPEVVEHHDIAIAAPAEVVLEAAKELEMMESPIIRAVIRMRELALGGEPDRRLHPAGLLEQMQSIGWVVLAETAGREIVLGSVTQPWIAAPVFRSIAADRFKDFCEPGFVKIAWTLRADPLGPAHAIFHTETRACTTDAIARKRFRRYWSYVAPGVQLIRLATLQPLRRAAEARTRAAA